MKIVKIFAVLLVLFVGVYIAFAKTQAGVLVLQLAAQKNSPGLTRLFTSLGANVEGRRRALLRPSGAMPGGRRRGPRGGLRAGAAAARHYRPTPAAANP